MTYRKVVDFAAPDPRCGHETQWQAWSTLNEVTGHWNHGHTIKPCDCAGIEEA